MKDPANTEHPKTSISIASGKTYLSDFFNLNGKPQSNDEYIVCPDWRKTDDDISWLMNVTNHIRNGNYDAIMPEDIGTIKRGAVLAYNDLDGGTPAWISIPDENANDEDRRNYVIHICTAAFVESLIGFLATPVTPDQAKSISPATMANLKTIMEDLRAIAAHNADPDIPFEDKLDGNRDLNRSTLSPEKKAEFRAIIFDDHHLGDKD